MHAEKLHDKQAKRAQRAVQPPHGSAVLIGKQRQSKPKSTVILFGLQIKNELAIIDGSTQ